MVLGDGSNQAQILDHDNIFSEIYHGGIIMEFWSQVQIMASGLNPAYGNCVMMPCRSWQGIYWVTVQIHDNISAGVCMLRALLKYGNNVDA